MNTDSNPARRDAQCERFAKLVELPEAERGQALAAMAISDVERIELGQLLAADAIADEALDASVSSCAKQTFAPSRAGDRFGPWRVLGEIGAGGMGTVFLGERADGHFEQKVAIKLLRGFPTADGRRRLRQERQVLAQLDHPGICRLIDGGETDDGQPYFVMEFVEGELVTAFAARRALLLPARIELIDLIAQALAHAHQRLVIHRDLKPANVMVGSDGRPKLLDFGVAKLIDIDAAADATSTRVWTPGYASPEQIAGRPITTASDVFALGTLLRELLTGERPDTVRSAAELLPVAIDADLAGLIRKATAEDPAQRYATIEAFRDDLSRWRDGRPLRAARDDFSYRLRKFLQRHRIATSLALLAVVACALFVWQLALQRNRAVSAEQQAQQARVQAEASALEAGKQLDRSRQAIEFLSSIFKAGDPDQTLGKMMTARDLLDAGERQLQSSPPADAGVRDDFAALLAQLYYKLGDNQGALRMLDIALGAAPPRDRSEALEFALRQEMRMGVHLAQGDAKNARVAAEAAVALRDRWAPNDEPARIASLWALSEVRKAEGDLEGANRHGLEGLQLADRSTGYAPILLINLLGTLADSASQAGDATAALTYADRMAREIAANPNIERSRQVWTQQLRSRALQSLGRLAEAELALQDAIDAQTRLIGDRGFASAHLINDLGLLQASAGRFDRAITSYQAYAELMRQSSDRKPEMDTVFLNNVCDAQNGLGDYAAALLNCEQAVRLIRQRSAPLAPDRLAVESQYARTLGFAGRAQESLLLFDDVIARAIQAFGETSVPVAVARFRAARVALLANDPKRAHQLAEQAQQSFVAQFASPHPWRARGARLLGLIALEDRQPDDAAKALAEAAVEIKGSIPPEHIIHLQLVADQAELSKLRGDPAQAKAQLNGVLTALRRASAAMEVDRVRAERLAKTLGL
ncbi:MAG: protein kinase [Xanthomonadales bacterium]|nr:protein kinase [Xanthomonadales bacterium]MCC6562769.1 protein kinase [Xanthomonadales bacterium]